MAALSARREQDSNKWARAETLQASRSQQEESDKHGNGKQAETREGQEGSQEVACEEGREAAGEEGCQEKVVPAAPDHRIPTDFPTEA